MSDLHQRAARDRIPEREINDGERRDYLEFILAPFHAVWIIQDPTELESALTRINTHYEQFVTLNARPSISVATLPRGIDDDCKDITWYHKFLIIQNNIFECKYAVETADNYIPIKSLASKNNRI